MICHRAMWEFSKPSTQPGEEFHFHNVSIYPVRDVGYLTGRLLASVTLHWGLTGLSSIYI